MKQSHIENALPIVASMYGRRYGVTVRVGGDSAHTDGKHIQLPSLPEEFPYKRALFGFLAHEAAHVKFTNFDCPRPGGIHHQIYNRLEDGRIETLMIQEYPGCSGTLDEALMTFIDLDKMSFVPVDAEPSRALTAFVLYWVRYVWRRQRILQGQFKSAERAFLAQFPRGAYIKLMALLHEAPSMTCSEDSHALADRILEMLDQESEDQDQPPQAGQNQSQEGESSSGNSGDETESDNADDGDESSGPNKPQPGDDGDESDQGASGTSEDEQTEPSEQEKKANLRKALADDGEGSYEADPFETMKDVLEEEAAAAPGSNQNPVVLPGSLEPVSMPQHRTQAQWEKVTQTSSVIRKQLLRMVQASERRRTRFVERGRRVSGNRLAGTVTGNMRVFRKEFQRKSPNTAVYLLVDGSSSMGSGPGSVMQVANEAALALALAIEALPKVTPIVSYFAGGDKSPVYEALKPGDRVQSKADKFSFCGMGGTPLNAGLWKAVEALAGRKEERKIVMVVTDGGPNDPDRVRETLARMQASGYEVMAVGIGSSAVSQYFTNHCVINTATDLETVLFGMVEGKLVA